MGGIPLDLEIHSIARGAALMPTIVDFPTIVKDAVDVFGDLFANGDCLKTGPEACWQVDTFSGHLTGAQSPQNNMITRI